MEDKSDPRVCSHKLNLFIPYGVEGSATAIMAHMYSYQLGGEVSIVRCEDSNEANQKIQELLHYITMADGYNAPQPKFREIWAVGFHLNGMVSDELMWFSMKPGRCKFKAPTALCLFEDCGLKNYLPESLCSYIYNRRNESRGESILASMLADDDYEHLMAYLLRMHPHAEDVTKEDYVVSMFVENEKKRRKRYE